MIRKSIPFLLFVVFSGGCMLCLAYPQFVLWIAIATVSISLGLFLILLLSGSLSAFDRVVFVIGSIVSIGSGMGFYLFLEQRIAQWFFLILISYLLALFSLQLNRHIISKNSYDIKQVSSVVSFISVISLFFFSVVTFDLRFFFSVKLVVLIPIFFIGAFCISLVTLWVRLDKRQRLIGYAVLLAFFMTECAVALTFWPHTPLIKGALTLCISYAMLEACALGLSQQFSSRRLLRILGIIASVVAGILLSAQWQ